MLNCKKFIYGQKRIKPLPKICLVSSKDRASDSESEGWGFESPARHQKQVIARVSGFEILAIFLFFES